MLRAEQPRETEIIAQLEKILASRYFVDADTQAKILRLMVESAISGTVIKQEDLETVNPTHFLKEESTKGRQNAFFVRQKVRKYYAKEGADDLVEIELPPGRSYKALFRYKINAAAIRAVRRARKYIERPSGASHFDAGYDFYLAEKAGPPAASTKAEQAMMELKHCLYDNLFKIYGKYGANPSSAEVHALQAIRINENCWNAYIVLGAARLMRFKWGQAGESFEKAKTINRVETVKSLWYAAYQIIIGNTSEALMASKEQALDNPEEACFQIVYALFLYLARRFDEAGSQLADCVANDYEEKLINLLSGLIKLAKGEAADAYEKFDEIDPISDHDREFTLFWSRRDYIKLENIRTGYFSGFKILSLAKSGNLKEALEMMARFKREYPVKGLQSALGYLAVGDNRRALIRLHRAACEGDFFLNLFHILPVFDDLRKDVLYGEIVEEMDWVREYYSLRS
jgi:tetratricopeptide (TPR) repeat protein